MDKILEFFAKAGVFFVTTVEEDAPKVRPFGFAMKEDGKLYFGTGKHKQIYRQMQQNPNVEVCAFDPESRKWLRVRGKAVMDDRQEIVEKCFTASPFLKTIYNEKTGYRFAPFYLTEGHAEIMDMGGYFEEFTF